MNNSSNNIHLQLKKKNPPTNKELLPISNASRHFQIFFAKIGRCKKSMRNVSISIVHIKFIVPTFHLASPWNKMKRKKRAQKNGISSKSRLSGVSLSVYYPKEIVKSIVVVTRKLQKFYEMKYFWCISTWCFFFSKQCCDVSRRKWWVSKFVISRASQSVFCCKQ